MTLEQVVEYALGMNLNDSTVGIQHLTALKPEVTR